MFDRDIIHELEKWGLKTNRKPLILRGARQVGKTTAVRMYADSFDQFIYLNLEQPDDRKLFDAGFSIDKVVDAIFFYAEKDKDNKRTLLFIDEIQNSTYAVTLLRYFYEEFPDLYVIAAGSLLESLIDAKLSFPVGRVEYLAVRPLTFLEFLNAMGELKSYELIYNLEFPDYAHDKLIELFKRYTTIGGMPEVIANYAENKDMNKLVASYEQLIITYQDDVEKYGKNQAMTHILRHVIGSAFQYAGERITFERFGNSPYKSRQIGDAFRTLEKAMLLKLIFPAEKVKLPVRPNFRKSPKIQLLDTGLVTHSANLQKVLFTSEIIDHVYRGKIAEHVIGQEILGTNSSVNASLNFWTRESRNSQAEVDFLVQYKDMLIPVEVKAGASGKLRSLHKFMDAAPHPWAVRFYSGKMLIEDAKTIDGKHFKLINLPHYSAGRLLHLLENIIK